VAWSVVRVRPVEPSPGRDAVAAAVVEIKQGEDERRITAELSGSASAAGITLDARDAVSRFLRAEEPPQRVIVTKTGVDPTD
jgi:hypothetical protein